MTLSSATSSSRLKSRRNSKKCETKWMDVALLLLLLLSAAAPVIPQSKSNSQQEQGGGNVVDPHSLFDILCGENRDAFTHNHKGQQNRIQKFIWEHQNPTATAGGCGTGKPLSTSTVPPLSARPESNGTENQRHSRRVVEWPDKKSIATIKLIGLGGQLSHLIVALGYAIATDAVLVVAQKSSQYAPSGTGVESGCEEGSLQCYLEPLSSCNTTHAGGLSLKQWSRMVPESTYAAGWVRGRFCRWNTLTPTTSGVWFGLPFASRYFVLIRVSTVLVVLSVSSLGLLVGKRRPVDID